MGRLSFGAARRGSYIRQGNSLEVSENLTSKQDHNVQLVASPLSTAEEGLIT